MASERWKGLLRRWRRLQGDYVNLKDRLSRRKELPYFREKLKDFGIILKGRSVEKIQKVYNEYNDCFIVNNFDKEIELLEKYLVGKNTVHYVNRLMTAPLTPSNYKKMGIKDIQLSKVSATGDPTLKEAIGHYRSLGLTIHFLPQRLVGFNQDFNSEYARKYPNTGVLAIIHALDIIRPENLWVVGLDFYQSDYLVRRPHQSPLEKQREKMNKIDIVNVFVRILKRYPDVNVNIVTYYDGLPELGNLTII